MEETKQINLEDPKEIYRKKVEEKSQELYANGRRPFCSRCALIDFDVERKKIAEEMELSEGFATMDKIESKLKEFVNLVELDKYGKEDRFTKGKQKEAMEPIPNTGQGSLIRKTKIGVHRDYKCKIRKCGISVFLSNEDLENEKKQIKTDIPIKTRGK